MTALKKMAAVLTAGLALGCFTTTKALAIVGGAAYHEILSPHVRISNSGPEHNCSGTVIAPTWVLTAAHCVGGGAYVRVEVASVDGAFTSYGVSRVVTAPYIRIPGGMPLLPDIALLETKAVLEGVPVAKYGTLSEEQAAIWYFKLYGYGFTEPVLSGQSGNESMSAILKSVDVLPVKDLGRWLRFVSPQGSACFGDSGGAAVATDPSSGEMIIVGVIIGGEDSSEGRCLPGKYTVVSDLNSVHDWIEQYTGVAEKINYQVSARVAVTQNNISETICTKAWLQQNSVSKKQVTLTALSGNLSKAGMTPNLVVPVSLGGVNNISNIGLVSKTGKYSVATKKLFEKWLHSQVCQQRMPLTKAQSLVIDWTANFDIYYQKN